MKTVNLLFAKSKLAIIFIIVLICTVNAKVFATTYTWSGTTSTSWNTSTNWSPNGIPGSGDNIIIVSATNNLALSGNQTVTTLTVSSDTIDLQNYILTITGNTSTTGGTITSSGGKLIISGTSTTTISATNLSTWMSVTANSITLKTSTFGDSLFLVKKGTSADVSKGGNTFNGYTSIIDSSTGIITFADSLGDTFNGALYLRGINTTGKIYIANQGTNTFNGTVKFDGGSLASNYYGTATYNGAITINNTASGGVAFGVSTGSCSFNSTFSIGTSGFTTGSIGLKNATFADSTISTSLTLTGGGQFQVISGSIFKGPLTVTAPTILLNGGRFNKTTTFTKNGTSTSNPTSLGGNYFADNVSFSNSMNTAWNLANTTVDTFMKKVSFIQNHNGSSSTFSVNNIYCSDSVLFSNTSSNSGEKFNVSNTGSSIFNGYVSIKSNISGATIAFCQGGGTSTFNSSSKLELQSGTGDLSLKNCTINSNYSTIILTGSLTKLTLNSGSSFAKPFSYTGPSISLNGCTFTDTVTILKTGSSSDICTGGNTFNGITTIEDNNNSSHSFTLCSTSSDIYNNHTTFKQTGSGGTMYLCNNNKGYFAKNLTLSATSTNLVIGNSANGRLVFSGSNYQTLSVLAGTPAVKKVEVNKSGGSVKFSSVISISDSLFLTKGVIKTDSTNTVSLADNIKLTGGSDSSFIHGPVKKTGNDLFAFPLGDTTLSTDKFHPLTISPPSSTSEVFSAHYIASNHSIVDSLDSASISTCEYWKLSHSTGSSKVLVTCGWNANSCKVDDLADVLIVGHEGTDWTNYHQGTITTNGAQGSLTSKDSVAISGSVIQTLTFGSTDSLSGYTCEHAIQLDSTDINNPTDYFYNLNNEIWYKFVADTSLLEFVYAPLKDSTTINIQSIELFKGSTCLTKTSTRLDTFDYTQADTLNIDSIISLRYPDLVPDSTYFIKATAIDLDDADRAGYNLTINLSDYLFAQCDGSCASELIGNPMFDIYDLTCVNVFSPSGGTPDPFAFSCIDCWRESHGTPHMNTANNHATMGTTFFSGGQGEGLFQTMDVSLDPSIPYILTYDYHWNWSAGNPLGGELVNCEVRTGTNGFWNGQASFETHPPVTGQLLSSESFVDNTSWTHFVTCFTPNQAYNRIRFWGTAADNGVTSQPTYFWDLDNVHVQPLQYDLEDKIVDCESVTIGPDCPSTLSDVLYYWQPGGQTTAQITVYPQTTTVYTLNTSVFNSATGVLCNFPSYVTATVITPAIALNLTTTDESCAGNDGSVCVTPSGGAGGYLYSWSTGATTSCITGLIPGNYTVAVSDNNGCASFATATVGHVDPIIDLGSDKTICSGGQVILGNPPNLVSNGLPPYTYTYTPGSGINTSGTSLIATPTATTTYTVTVTDANGCTGTDAITITVNTGATSPPANAGIDKSAPELTSCGSWPAFVGDPLASLSFQYSWTCGNSFALTMLGSTTAPDPSVTYSFPPIGVNLAGNSTFNSYTYLYFLTVTDPSTGCSSMDDVKVSFGVCRRATKGELDSDMRKEIYFEMFPNPTSGIVEISNTLKLDIPVTVELFDLLGNKVKSLTLDRSFISETINIRDLPAGIYMYQIVGEGQLIQIDKLIKL